MNIEEAFKQRAEARLELFNLSGANGASYDIDYLVSLERRKTQALIKIGQAEKFINDYIEKEVASVQNF